MKPFPQSKNILFIRLRLLGDIVFTLPALQLFRSKYPYIGIYYVVEEEFKGIGELIPGVERLVVIPRRMSLIQMWNFRKTIKDLDIDTVVDFHGGPKSAQLTWITGIKNRIGYRTPNRNWAYNHLSPRKFGNSYSHSVFNQAKLLELMGIPVQYNTLPGYPEIKVDEDLVTASVKVFLKKENKIVIHVGAGNEFRDWGIENFISLIRKLKQKHINVVLVGNGEKEILRASELEAQTHVDNLTGKLSIPDLYYLISCSNVYFGADSGPLHLASLTSTPLVALYGPNLPDISGPWRKNNVTIMQIPMACRPCTQRKCIYGIIPCMKNIKTDEVYEAICGYLK